MAEQMARVLYDFEGDTENGELVIREGDAVVILDQNVGDGWWEARVTKSGQTGLVPETYIELLNGEGGRGGGEHDEAQLEGDEQQWDEEEDEWDENPQDEGGGVSSSSRSYSESYHNRQGTESDRYGDQRSRSPAASEKSTGFGRAGTVKKNLNRFSPFVKAGAETFILGVVSPKAHITAQDKLRIVLSPEQTPMWEPSSEPFTVEIRDPEKKKKFKGMKSFTAYRIVPSSTGRMVSRRYKHYDWLHQRLVEKFTVTAVPPLPDKQYYGRYGEDFVEKRRQKLQMWSNRITRHPVLCRSEVIIHFFLCDDDGGSQWKAGKRRAEKDEIIAGVFFSTVEHPEVHMERETAESEVEHFGKFLHAMKESVAKVRGKFIDHCNQMSGPFAAEFHKMAAVVNGLAQCFAIENKDYSKPLTDAISQAGETLRDIGQMHAEQPKYDMLPALDVLKEYIGMMQEFPDLVEIHRGAMRKVKDADRMKEEGRIDVSPQCIIW
jgi:sorting nexin-9/18/33